MVTHELTLDSAWHCLHAVPDPEIPVISVTELGIVREVKLDGDAVHVVVTPTYSGCPATEAINQSIKEALVNTGFKDVRIEMRLSPAWTTDWIDEKTKEKLREYGIAPPGEGAMNAAQEKGISFVPYRPACPRCGSKNTARLSQFGATACKALYRCDDCREPFEYFKPI